MRWIVILALMTPLSAQVYRNGIPPRTESASRALQQLERQHPEKQTDRASQRQRAELESRMVDFANAWNRLMQLAEKGVWNPKEARKAHQAFERLIQCEGWLEEKKQK